MGTLVFQATLGGAVNIIGPNIASTINFTLPSADGTSGQTWTTNGSGVLAFGTLGIAGGGTGQITATAAFNALAPSQSGQSGKYLTTDGTNTSWGTNPLGTVTSVGGTGTVNGITLTGTVTTSGNLTLGGTLSGIANSALTNSSITIGGTAIALGASSNALANDITVYGVTVGRGAGAVSSNTAVGASAIAGSNTGSQITAVGSGALQTNTTGNYNSGFGGNALNANTTGSGNNAFGGSDTLIGSALAGNTTGDKNNAFGNGALVSNLSGSNNAAFGHQALNQNTTASNNTAVGYQAGYSNTTGQLTAIGYQAGYANTTGIQSTFVGYQAGYNTTGTANTFVGGGTSAAAGYSVTTGTKNTILGGYTGNQTLPYTGNTLDIRTSSANIVLSDGDGNAWFYINSTGVTRAEGVTSNTTGNAANVQCDASGALRTSTSALKYKTNIRDIASIDINKFRPIVYNSLCKDDDKTKDHFGFIADEVDQLGIKELVSYNLKGEVEGFQYDRMTVILTKALQEQQAIIESLKARLDAANL